MLKRFAIASGAGTSIAICLFYLMSSLISTGKDMGRLNDSENQIEFLRVKDISQAETRKRVLPKKPPLPKNPPRVEKMQVAKMNAPKMPDMKIQAPKLANNLALGDGPFLGAAGAAGSGGTVMPLMRIEPQYPRKAAMKGVQGWVVLKFDITAVGTVENVEVLQAQPRRVFDSAAKRALLKWKYKPKVEDGKPVSQLNNKVKIDFKLEG